MLAPNYSIYYIKHMEAIQHPPTQRNWEFEEIIMNAFDKAVSDNGFVVIDGVKHALGQQPYLDELNGVAVYKSYGFTQAMLDDDGMHDPLFDDSVIVYWDNRNSDVDVTDDMFDCDWENEAFTL